MAEAQVADPLWDSLVKQAGSLTAGSEEITRQLGESAAVKSGIAKRLLTDKPPPAPEIAPPTPPPPPMQQTDQMKSFGSAATILGIMGGLLTRAPLTASLNAATGAMNAYKQRDLEAYKQNYDTWKAQSDYMGKVADWQQNQYRMALDQHKDDHDSLVATMNAIAARDQDLVMQHTIKTGDLRNVMQLLADRDKAIDGHKRTSAYSDDVFEQKRHHLEQENEARNKITAARQKAVQVVTDGRTLLTEIDRLKKNIDTASQAGVSSSGKLGYVQSIGEAIGLSSGDIATRINTDKAALKLKVESYLRRSRPNRWSEDQIQQMIKGYGFMETDKATMTGLNSLEQVVKDEISSAGEDAGPATPGPMTGTPIIPLPGGTAPAPGASPEISDEARRRYDAIFGGGEGADPFRHRQGGGPANAIRQDLPSSASRPYPSSREGEEDERAGIGYGSGYEMSLTRDARVIDASRLRGTEDQIFDQIAKKLSTANPAAADVFRRAAVAANRSAISGLGFDPRKIAIDMSGEKKPDFGLYDPDKDVIWMTNEDPTTAVHESMHRGLEMLRKARALTRDERRFVDKNDELIVRYMMFHMMGDPEGVGGPNDKREHDEAITLFSRGPNALNNRLLLSGIEKKAASLVAKRRQYGPR